MKRLVLGGLLSVWIGAGLLLGQPAPSLDPAKAITQYAHDQWGIDEGLPVKTVTALLQTRDGYLWVGTQEGLARFDGLHFYVFDKRNTRLQSSNIKALLEARDGTLWVGTRGGGVVTYRDGVLTPHPLNEQLTSLQVSALGEDSDGGLWVGTFGDGLNRIDPDGTVHRWTTDDGLPSNNINTLLVSADGVVWIGTRDQGLVRFEDGRFMTFTTADGLAGNDITVLYEDAGGDLWIGTRDAGLMRRDPAGRLHTLLPAEGQEATHILAVYRDRAGSLWIGTARHGLYRYREGRFEHFTRADGLASDIVQALYEDREGSLWIGTESGGLERLWNGRFTPYTTREGLPAEVAYAVYEDRQGALWVGSPGGGVTRIHAGRIQTFTTADGLPHDYVLSLAGTADGSLWMGTPRGLARYRDGRFTTYTTADGLPAPAVYALYTDSKDNLWIGTTGGLARYRDGHFTTYTTADGLTSKDITVILEDRQGSLWVGTYDGGLNRMEDGRVVAHYGEEEGLLSGYVLTLYEDADGVLWFGLREGGLYRLEDGHLTRFTTAKGLFNDTIQHLLEDDRGTFWMTSNQGLFRVSRASLNAFARGELPQLTCEVYDRSDGLKTREFMGGFQPAGWKGRDGRLWFPSNDGIVAIDPHRLSTNVVPPPVVLEQVVVDGQPRPLPGAGEVVHLQPGAHKFEFHYVGLSLIASDKIRYQYRLEGEDEQWVEAGSRRVAYYSNLRPGSYRFEVRAVNRDGVWSANTATIAFYLEPYFYQTRWFWVVGPLMVLLLALWAYRWRISQLKAREQALERIVADRTRELRAEKEKTEAQARRLREMDQIKTRFFSNISHEFRTPLTLNIGPLEDALTGLYGPLSDTLREQLSLMLRNSRRLLRLVNQLLDLSKLESGKMALNVQPGNVVEFIEGIVLSFTAFVEKRGIDLRFHTTHDDLTLYFDKTHLEKVFFNLLSNAIKFTPDGGRIEVALAEDRLDVAGEQVEALRVTVRDSGAGIPTEELPYVFDRFHQVDGAVHRVQEGTGIGLSLVKELVELHGGVISVESAKGEGTTFTVRLPRRSPGDLQPGSSGSADEEPPPNRGPLVEVTVLNDEAEAYLANREAAAEVSGDEARPLVLVVDDNPDIRAYVAGCLQGPYALALACNGEEGLEQARRLRPSLIISDVMMPVMDGYALCRAVKQEEALRHIPLILLTSKASVEDKIEGLEAGADDYIPKPFNARELLARVDNLLRLREQQHALITLNRELVRTNEALREASEMKSQLLSIASHDMKNPLTAIREFANIIIEELEPDSHLIELLELVYESSDQMLRLITRMLDSAALESGKIQLDMETVDLGDVARMMVQRNEKQAEKKGQQLHFEADREASLLVRADAERIAEAMDNLISNAIKYSPLDKPIDVSLTRQGPEIRFAVRDEGPGLTEEDQRKLFGKFQKLSARPTNGESSTGLGLSIVKQIVELHGGRVWAESTPGQGSTFFIALPSMTVATRADHPARAAGNPSDSRGASPQGTASR